MNNYLEHKKNLFKYRLSDMLNLSPLNYSDLGWFDIGYLDHIIPVIKETLPEIIIEVGSYCGMSTRHFLDVSTKLFGLQTNIVCIDTWLGSIEHENMMETCSIAGMPILLYIQFLTNMKYHDYIDNIIPIPNTSLNTFKILQKHNITSKFIYIDGDHSLDGVKEDICNYFELLESGGYLLIDDYDSPVWVDVRNAVDYFLQNNLSKIESGKQVSKQFLIKKK